jgi:elongation factor Ts
MNKSELIKDLRNLTQAGMKDCKDALEESNWDLDKAVDVIKVKGLNVVSGRASKVAADGIVAVYPVSNKALVLVEVNCQTDFVANSDEFRNFVQLVTHELARAVKVEQPFDPSVLEVQRQELVSKIKENIVIRRWWVEEVISPDAVVCSYVHSNSKIGVLLTLHAPLANATDDQVKELLKVGDDLAMQIAAMNPLAVSEDRLSPEEISRQKDIFFTQLKELNKPAAQWDKIVEGKLRKWYQEVTLLEQESVIVPKTTVRQVLADLGSKLGAEIQVVNFIRCAVGEGLDKKSENFAEEVAKLV